MSKIQELFQNRVHIGHRRRYWNPKMEPFIHGARGDVHIIDLEQTQSALNNALLVIRQTALNEGKIVFVGTKYLAQDVVATEAKRCGMYYVNYRWLGGMLTNHKTIRQSVKKLSKLEKDYEKTGFDFMVKKERLRTLREMNRLEDNFAGVKDLRGLPDLLVVIDVGYEKIAVEEANKLGIPVVGLVDTNSSPDGIDYPIPANDDASVSIAYFCRSFADEVLAAKEEVEARKQRLSKTKPEVTYRKVQSKPSEKEVATKNVSEKKPTAAKSKSKAAAPKKEVVQKTEDKVKAASASKPKSGASPKAASTKKTAKPKSQKEPVVKKEVAKTKTEKKAKSEVKD